ncbi:MAG: hypothetical protein WC623_21130 [Pedobacter sp.]|uniref:hypothetical protein n=1 Tax=Pedobacter sp. TaxID=1411316 RepID=UPI0035666104
MKSSNYIKPIFVFFIIFVASFRANSQTTDLKDYVITGYYANSATAIFKTPFIFNMGENNTFQYLTVDGKLHEGKYTVVNNNLKLEFISGEYNFRINGATLVPVNNRTFAKLEKKIFGNRLKGNRFTGILYKQNSNVAVRTNYQFIGDKFGISDENSKGMSFQEYTLVGNMAGYKWNGPGGFKSLISHRIFALYGDQLVVMNIYRNGGATYGILDLVTK